MSDPQRPPWAVHREPAPIIRAFEHHDAAGIHSQFSYVGIALTPGDDGLDVPGEPRLLVNLQGNGEKLTLREAHLVAVALAAGRRIEAALIALENPR